MNVLEVKDLRKSIGKREIIKGISFDVKQGEIYGFLGPNGAGKTTTIRMLVGLIKPSDGTIKIGGKDLQKNSVEALNNVGAVVENPELYKYLSGRENLMQIAKIRKIEKKEVEEIIELIGLKERINDKFGKYSLGMKQRLGLGAALLSKPKLLILDEPTNGLDPSGILDFRKIVKSAAKERGMAVFVSSHILSEVQQLCDKVAFINHGVIKSIESINDGNMETESEFVVVRTNNKEKTKEILENLIEVEKIVQEGDDLNIQTKVNSTAQINKELVKHNVEVKEIFIKQKGLEQRYMELVEGGIR